MIWKAYKYLFYQNIVWNEKRGEWGWGKYATSWAVMGMCYSSLLYFFACGMLGIYVGYDFIFPVVENNMCWILILIGVPLIHHYLFMYKGRYKRIIEEFKTDDPRKQMWGQIIFGIYVLGSMASFFISGYLMHYSITTGFTLIKYFGW